MKNFHIERPDESIREALIDKINNLTKPKGALGIL
ncbi:MAG: nicotinate-nucleotide--dimethylbenzimidazole phosphoribosyltransferase, partial [Phocaeicola sp.]|nr:nicotinate-nucleotide--dimethylbenzimidazole phosphoribosyltransferase [Phocaeicola sp.]